MDKILTGSKFDFIATHYCGASIYRVTRHQQAELEKHIPDNLFELTREELAPVVKSLMEAMNILWSSSGGIPNFSGKFGKLPHGGARQEHDREATRSCWPKNTGPTEVRSCHGRRLPCPADAGGCIHGPSGDPARRAHDGWDGPFRGPR